LLLRERLFSDQAVHAYVQSVLGGAFGAGAFPNASQVQSF